jgi:hypothetical protein
MVNSLIIYFFIFTGEYDHIAIIDFKIILFGSGGAASAG